MADIKDLNSYTFPSGQKLVDISHEDYDKWFKNTDPWIFKYYGTEEEITKVNEYAKDVENNYKEYQKLSTPENHKKLLNSYIDYDVYGRFIVANHIKPNATDLIKEKNSREANGERISYDDKKYQIFDVNVINYPKGYDDWLEQKNKELEKQIQQQLLKEQEKEDIQTTIAIDSIAKDIRIEPYSRKPEDIEAMKGFVAKVSGETIENITNQQAQAFIDNLGTTEEAYLTVKKDGTFEYTNNNPYSPEIYKTSEPKEILSILEDYANDHLTGHEQESEQEKDYEFIHSVNERFNEINKEYLIKNTSDKAEELRNALQEKDKELNIWIAKAEADNKEISRLNDQLEAANKIIQEQNQLLEGKGSVKVNGVERTFEHGLKQAFPEAVKRIDIENQRNKDLTADYNELLKSQSQNIAPVSPTDYDTRSD